MIDKNYVSIKDALQEYHNHFVKKYGFNPLHPSNTRDMLKNRKIFMECVNFFKERLPEGYQKNFEQYAVNAGLLLENQMTASGLTQYETFTLPILANVYPRIVVPLVATEIAMDTPEIQKSFLKVYFTKSGGTEKLEGPIYDQEISGGPYLDDDVAIGETDLLALFASPLTSDIAHIEKGTFYIRKVNGVALPKAIQVKTDGNFGFAVADATVAGGDFITGNVDYEAGILRAHSTTGNVTDLNVVCRATLERNTISPKIEMFLEKFDIVAKLRQIEASFTVPYQQDILALYKIDSASKLVAASTEQVALDIDIEYFKNVRDVVSVLPSDHRDTFSFTPPAGSSLTNVEYHRDILPKLGVMAGRIKKATKVNSAEVVLVCNDTVSSIFDSLANFKVVRKEEGGRIGFEQGTINDGRYTTIQSPIFDDDEIIMVLKGNDDESVISYAANYVPGMSVSLPNGLVPTLTFMRRSTTQIVRETGFGRISISNL